MSEISILLHSRDGWAEVGKGKFNSDYCANIDFSVCTQKRIFGPPHPGQEVYRQNSKEKAYLLIFNRLLKYFSLLLIFTFESKNRKKKKKKKEKKTYFCEIFFSLRACVCFNCYSSVWTVKIEWKIICEKLLIRKFLLNFCKVKSFVFSLKVYVKTTTEEYMDIKNL